MPQIVDEIMQLLSLVDSMFSLMVRGAEFPLASLYTSEDGTVDGENADVASVQVAAVGESLLYPLERYLEDFLVSNWDKTVLGRTLALHTEDEKSTTQYPTDVGPIDILARDRTNQDWLAIELKKGKSSDAVVDQLLRYMGWVKAHKAADGECVRGIIITAAPNDRITHTMLMSHGILFYAYRVSFDLVEEKSV